VAAVVVETIWAAAVVLVGLELVQRFLLYRERHTQSLWALAAQMDLKTLKAATAATLFFQLSHPTAAVVGAALLLAADKEMV
jgi:hypothetical protein